MRPSRSISVPGAVAATESAARAWPRRGERGVALVLTLLALLLIATMGSSLVLTTMTETLIGASYRDASEARYAAEAGVERALQDLLTLPDWTLVLTSSDGLHAAVPSGFLGPSLTPVLADDRAIDLRQVTNSANCPQVASSALTSCSTAQVQAATAERPWGSDNPHWRLYAHGRLADLLPGRVESPFYVAVWTADDPAETDHDPSIDGGPGQIDLDGDGEMDAANPGANVVQVRAESFGPRGARRTIEVTVTRVAPAAQTEAPEGESGAPMPEAAPSGETASGGFGLRVLSWRLVR